jgi:hypothetical protein
MREDTGLFILKVAAGFRLDIILVKAATGQWIYKMSLTTVLPDYNRQTGIVLKVTISG